MNRMLIKIENANKKARRKPNLFVVGEEGKRRDEKAFPSS